MWQASPDSKGHGSFGIHGGKIGAHVFAWVIANGPIPDGLEVDHHVCQRRGCVEVSHLRLKTPKQNSRRRLMHRNNTSGYRGVFPTENGRWRARIRVDNRLRSLGTFDTPEEAAAVVRATWNEIDPQAML